MKTLENLADEIVANAKTRQWLNKTEEIQLRNGVVTTIGCKAFGKWLQVATCQGIRGGGSSGNKTLKAFRADVVETLSGITRHVL